MEKKIKMIEGIMAQLQIGPIRLNHNWLFLNKMEGVIYVNNKPETVERVTDIITKHINIMCG